MCIFVFFELKLQITGSNITSKLTQSDRVPNNFSIIYLCFVFLEKRFQFKFANIFYVNSLYMIVLGGQKSFFLINIIYFNKYRFGKNDTLTTETLTISKIFHS